jgi:uncharacterized membrane protein YeaQ/YmgE (transglycosylase-associated protein family)
LSAQIAGGFLALYLGVTTTVTSHSIIEVINAFLGASILPALLSLVGVFKRGRVFP